jgi:hypothetical protein
MMTESKWMSEKCNVPRSRQKSFFGIDSEASLFGCVKAHFLPREYPRISPLASPSGIFCLLFSFF